jgi:plastocyanin
MRGIIIVGATLAIAGGLLLYFFDEMIANPPPVALQPAPGPEPGPGPTPGPVAGTTEIKILAGSSIQGAPDYDPDAGEVPLGNTVVWVNEDNTLHTATSGAPGSQTEAFDTGFLDPGAESDPVEIAGAAVGDAFDYFCQVHPYMLATLTITEAEEGGATGGEGAATGPTINILAGSSTQGAPDFDPDPLTVTKGDTITVTNQDNTLHTVTSGDDVAAADAGDAFNTDFMNPGSTATIDTSGLDAGEYAYICLVHPFMQGVLNITE